jgi:hypothetical protein
VSNCKCSFMDAALIQRKLRLPILHARAVAQAEAADAMRLAREVLGLPEPQPVAPVAVLKPTQESTSRPLCREHREKTSVMSWATLHTCTAWDCSWGTNVDGEWRAKTHSNKEVALPFDPNENLEPEVEEPIDEREPLIVEPQTRVAGEELDDTREELSDELSGTKEETDPYAAYAGYEEP